MLPSRPHRDSPGGIASMIRDVRKRSVDPKKKRRLGLASSIWQLMDDAIGTMS
jgi:hypothetical protein